VAEVGWRSCRFKAPVEHAETRSVHRLAILRSLFARTPDPYAGADLENARRLGSVLLVIGTAITVALFPFAPPDDAIGNAGWAVATVSVAVSLAAARQIRASSTNFRVLLIAGYVAMAQLALLKWLAGGSALYDQLFLLAFIFIAAVHPPRVAAAALGFGSVAFLSSLAYAGSSSDQLAGIVIQLLIWWGLMVVTMALMMGVRAQRLQEEQERRLARVDPLTGLGNRRAFDESLGREVSRARRNEVPLSLLLVDIDTFKQVNDDYGHPTGDECLRGVADALRLTVRGHDRCFRWGGDEFAALLDTGREGALEVGKRLTQTVRAAGLGPADHGLAISCGVACMPDAQSGEELVGRADIDLLASKRNAGARRRVTA
jgi:diguanylate cyclase (GGDEF)-like protein